MGEAIYFDGIDNTGYVTGKAKHSARDGWIYTDGEKFLGMRYDVGGDPSNPDMKIAWKMLYTSKDTWLGPTLDVGAIGSTYNLTMDPYEKYDMTFNGAVAVRNPTTSPGRYAGMDNGWAIRCWIFRSRSSTSPSSSIRTRSDSRAGPPTTCSRICRTRRTRCLTIRSIYEDHRSALSPVRDEPRAVCKGRPL